MGREEEEGREKGRKEAGGGTEGKEELKGKGNKREAGEYVAGVTLNSCLT